MPKIKLPVSDTRRMSVSEKEITHRPRRDRLRVSGEIMNNRACFQELPSESNPYLFLMLLWLEASYVHSP